MIIISQSILQNITSYEARLLFLLQGVAGLGFAIVEEVREGRQGIYVRNITPGGVAAQVMCFFINYRYNGCWFIFYHAWIVIYRQTRFNVIVAGNLFHNTS